jgi:hypothetical protein
MKSKLLLATALASLLASAGIAGAQGTNEQGHKGPGAAAPSTQRAQSPSEHAQPGNRMGQSERSPSNNRTTNPSAQDEKNRTKNSSAQNETNRTQNPSAQNERNRMAHPSAQNGQNERSRTKNPSAQNERNRTQNPSAQNEKNRMQNPSAQNERNRMERNPSATENERGTAASRQGTSENRGASALSTEQRSRIRTTVLGERNAPRIAQSDININLRVGARIPRDRLHIRPLPLPQTVVEVEPRWRGYDYFLVGNEIVVVEPNTFEIVAIIPA